MALFYEARLFISDENGVAINGGKARFRDANTLNLTSLFSDVTLSTPLTNPVVADGNGWTPQIFAAEGTVCDLQYLTAGDVAIPSRNYVDVVAIGSDTGGFSRDFTTSRVAMRGSGGISYVDFGDASPDNTGGTASFGGWLGTQADLITMNAVLLNTTGRFKENSKKLPGIVYTDKTAFATAATVDIQLPNDPTGVTAWDIDVWGMTQSAGDDLLARLSYDGGIVYRSTAADYSWVRGYDGQSSGRVSGASASATSIAVMTGTTGAANKPASFRIRVYTPNSGNHCTTVSWEGEGVDATEHYRVQGAGYGPATLGRATHIRLLLSAAATITGQYRVVPVRGTGDT